MKQFLICLLIAAFSSSIITASSSTVPLSSSAAAALQSLPQDINCTTDLDCPLTQFCLEQAGHCACLDSYKLNPEFGKPGSAISPACIPKQLLGPDSTGTRCTSSSQCIPNAQCNTRTGRCDCIGEGWAVNGGPWRCRADCTDNQAVCQLYHNQECRVTPSSEGGKQAAENNKQCYCKRGFTRFAEGCLRSMSPLGAPCQTNDTSATVPKTLACGQNALCRNVDGDGRKAGTCACRVESLPEPNDEYNCKVNNCTADADCQRQHANTYCKVEWNQCDCVPNFENRGEGCFLKEGIKKLWQHCKYHGDCSFLHAECKGENGEKKVCRCKVGSRPALDGVNCVPVACTKREDCTAVNSELTCNATSNLCYQLPSSAFRGGSTLILTVTPFLPLLISLHVRFFQN